MQARKKGVIDGHKQSESAHELTSNTPLVIRKWILKQGSPKVWYSLMRTVTGTHQSPTLSATEKEINKAMQNKLHNIRKHCNHVTMM